MQKMNWWLGVASKAKGARGKVMLVLWAMVKQHHKGGKTQLGMLVFSLIEFGHFCITFKLSFSINLFIVEFYFFCLELLWICLLVVLQTRHKWPWLFLFL
jgi:hypothetical protein